MLRAAFLGPSSLATGSGCRSIDAKEDALFFGSQSLKGVAAAYFTANYVLVVRATCGRRNPVVAWFSVATLPDAAQSVGGAIHRWNGELQVRWSPKATLLVVVAWCGT